jgi:hypothetical protein
VQEQRERQPSGAGADDPHPRCHPGMHPIACVMPYA